MKNTLAGVACAALLGLAGAETASANPMSGGMSGSAAGAAPQSRVEQVHGCHRDVRRGGAGWHRHAGPNCRRVAAGRDRPRGKRYWWKGPRCSTYCVGVGPLRVCDRDCG